MMLIDVHAHLTANEFASDLDAVLEEARSAGVQAILSVSENLKEAEALLGLAGQHALIRPCAGLYPIRRGGLDLEQMERMEAFIREHRDNLAAIGEVGLDYWVVKEEPQRELQRQIFRRFIRLSNELDLPLNIHSRAAGHYAIALLREEGARRVLLHAFDGRPAAALAGVEAGYWFSIPPSVVRSAQKQKLVRRLPLEALLLESDAPVLGPDKGVRNVPANVAVACRAIAEIKGVSPEAVAEATTANARKLFPWVLA